MRKTLEEICDEEFDGDILPDMTIEFAEEGNELDEQLDYLDEILETHGKREVEYYAVVNSSRIKVLFAKED